MGPGLGGNSWREVVGKQTDNVVGGDVGPRIIKRQQQAHQCDPRGPPS